MTLICCHCNMCFVLIIALNTLRPKQNGGHHFADDIFECIFLNGNIWIPIKILLKFVPKASVNNIPASVQILAWRRPGDKPLSEPMMVCLPMHICVTRPQLCDLFTNIGQDCFTGTRAIVRLPPCEWYNPERYRQNPTSHYLNQRRHIVNWTIEHKFQWNLNTVFFQGNAFESLVWKKRPFVSASTCWSCGKSLGHDSVGTTPLQLCGTRASAPPPLIFYCLRWWHPPGVAYSGFITLTS